MGNEVGNIEESMRNLPNTSELEHIQSELKSTYNNRSSEAKIKKHGWDPKDHSANISIQDDNQLAVRGASSGSTDVVRGGIGYKGGVFLFEFEWKPGEDKTVCVGLATIKAPLTSEALEGSTAYLGHDGKSIGWDLVNRCIRFNGCEMKPYPGHEVAEKMVPSTFVMILDMSRGTLSFRTAALDYGVAMEGLRDISDHFCVAACMSQPDDSVRITYLGGLSKIKRALMSSSLRSSDKLRFHEAHGKNITLTNNNRTALRKEDSLGDTHACSTALTHRPLKEGETFLVRLDFLIEKWRGACVVGGTTAAANEINFEKKLTSCDEGEGWIFMENKRLSANKTHKGNFDPDLLKTGDIVGLKRCERELQFLYNGSRVAGVITDSDDSFYGFVDVRGPSTKVSIVDGHEASERCSRTERVTVSLSNGGVTLSDLPKTHEEFLSRINNTIHRLKDKSPEAISTIHHHLKVDILIPYAVITSSEVKKEAAEKMGEFEDVGQIITDYLQFLWELGLESDEKINDCYTALLSIIISNADRSALLSKKLGEAGLLQWLIAELKRMADTHLGNNRETRLVRQYITILHNCSKTAANQPMYRDCGAVDLRKQYGDLRVGDEMISICAYFIMAYICGVDQLENLGVTDQVAGYIVRMLSKSAANETSDGRHSFDGWCCEELADGITNLARHQPNIAKFMKEDPIPHFIKMLSFTDESDKESGLNAITSLVTNENRTDIIKSGGLVLKLKRLTSHPEESVKRAALRLMARLTDEPQEGAAAAADSEGGGSMHELMEELEHRDNIPRACDYQARCYRFKAQLNLPDEYFDTSKDVCYCTECHDLRAEDSYSTAGQPPKRYGVPVGWCKFGLSLPPRARVLKVEQEWHRAYHGTKQDHIEGILTVGEIVPAGQPVLGGAKITEGSGHFNSVYKPSGFDTKRVFLSPSIRYAGVNCYTKPKLFVDSLYRCMYNVRSAFEVCIAPGSYNVSPSTLGSFGRMDRGFSNRELEWSTNQRGSCIMYGLLIKLEVDTDALG